MRVEGTLQQFPDASERPSRNLGNNSRENLQNRSIHTRLQISKVMQNMTYDSVEVHRKNESHRESEFQILRHAYF